MRNTKTFNSENIEEIQRIENKFTNDIPTSAIYDHLKDYVLRCIKGPEPYVGKSFYINLTDEGELIGSDPS